MRKRSAFSSQLSAGDVRRPAFTLVEMLVSLAVIVVALAVVVSAFTITTQTARQAAAFAELQGWIRQFAFQASEDLRYCDPAQSVLVIVGRTQQAARNEADLPAQRRLRFLLGDPADVPANYNPTYDPALDAPGGDGQSEYSDPRADILMLWTNRPTVSRAPATDRGSASSVQQSLVDGARVSPVQIVYGHAAKGEAIRQANGVYQWTNSLTHITDTTAGGLSRIPAENWHLARRVILPAREPGQASQISIDDTVMSRLVRCEPTPAESGDSADFDFPGFMAALNDYVMANPARTAAYDFGDGSALAYNDGTIANLIDDVLYNGAAGDQHIATVLDSPPVDLRNNLGVHMLPGCAWFQVEFLMPEDARNCLDYDPDPSGGSTQRNQIPRWTEVKPGETYVFLPDTPENRARVARERWMEFSSIYPDRGAVPATFQDTVERIRVRLWPYALRITVRAYDPRGRLSEPLSRTIVHRFD